MTAARNDVTVIYCGGGNPALVAIATAAGMRYGARLPDTIYEEAGGPLYFADQNFHKVHRTKYMEYLARHRPAVATVLDWSRRVPFAEVLDWAEEAAAYCRHLVIIPKIPGTLARIPQEIGGRPVRLGFSVPTRYGSTPIVPAAFGARPVHLLGGSPHTQLKLRDKMNVVSADLNMHQKLATRFCQFWSPGKATYARNHFWPTLKEADGGKWQGETPAYQEAFRRSCTNIMQAWRDPCSLSF